jgi:hypothetical protein
MKFILLTIIFLMLVACGSGSSGQAVLADVNAKVLSEHACLEGSWMAVSRNVKINGENHPVATSKIFMVISAQQNISTSENIDNGQVMYQGQEIRTWHSYENHTEDIHSNSWNSLFTFSRSPNIGTFSIIDACRNQYDGVVREDQLPQCSENSVFSRHTHVTLTCSGNVGQLTMENTKSSINYQRVTDNTNATNFNDQATQPLTPELQPPEPIDLLEPEDIQEIIEQALADAPSEEAKEALKDITDSLEELDHTH